MPSASLSWNAPVPIDAVATWPLMHSTGTESLIASSRPVMVLHDARPGGDEHDADAAGAARIALGGMHRRLLVAHQHVAQPRLLVERVVERQRRAARVAEDGVDAAVDQRLQQRGGAVAGDRAGAPLVKAAGGAVSGDAARACSMT